MNLKHILITLSSIAGVLGLITFYVVFYGNNGTYVVNSGVTSGTSVTDFASTSAAFASSTPSSTLSLSSSTTSSTTGNATSSGNGSQQYASNYTNPPISWTEGGQSMAITNATLSGSQLTLQLQITMGNIAGCVPLDLRLITDESGNTTGPLTPQFTFPDSGTCAGTPGETYTDQEVVFSVDPTAMPLILTTGGTSNILFEINATNNGQLTIELPPNAG